MSLMPMGEPTKKSMQEEIAALRREVRALQRETQKEPMTEPKEDQITFSHPGEPEAGMTSPPYRYRRPSGYLTSVSISADTVGSTATTLRVFTKAIGKTQARDLATVVLDADDDYTIEDDLMGVVEELDRVFVVFDAVGEEVADLTVTATFMESVE